jgi:hypothetical protein
MGFTEHPDRARRLPAAPHPFQRQQAKLNRCLDAGTECCIRVSLSSWRWAGLAGGVAAVDGEGDADLEIEAKARTGDRADSEM